MDTTPTVLGVPNNAAATAEEVLDVIAKTAASADVVAQTKVASSDIVKLLAEREQLAPTAIGSGVAIPHCFLGSLERFVVGLMTTERGIDFSAPDGKPVRLFFFILGPSGRRNQHVRMLSEISRTARSPAMREELLSEADPRRLTERLRTILRFPEAASEQERCLLQVFVQNDVLFDPILEELSAQLGGSIAVHELRSAGSYLHRLPLFAAMWTEQADAPVREIVGVIDKHLLNETARRLHQIATEEGSETGMLITAHDLLYASGRLDF